MTTVRLSQVMADYRCGGNAQVPAATARGRADAAGISRRRAGCRGRQERVFDQSMIPRGAKQDADGRVVVSSGEFLYNLQNAFERLSKQRAPSKVLDAVRHLLQFICFPDEDEPLDNFANTDDVLVAEGDARMGRTGGVKAQEIGVVGP